MIVEMSLIRGSEPVYLLVLLCEVERLVQTGADILDPGQEVLALRAVHPGVGAAEDLAQQLQVELELLVELEAVHRPLVHPLRDRPHEHRDEGLEAPGTLHHTLRLSTKN